MPPCREEEEEQQRAGDGLAQPAEGDEQEAALDSQEAALKKLESQERVSKQQRGEDGKFVKFEEDGYVPSITEDDYEEAIVDEMIDELIVDDGMMRPITSSKRDTSRHLHPAKADKHVKVSSQQTYLICTLVRVPMYSRHVWMAEADTVF